VSLDRKSVVLIASLLPTLIVSQCWFYYLSDCTARPTSTMFGQSAGKCCLIFALIKLRYQTDVALMSQLTSGRTRALAPL